MKLPLSLTIVALAILAASCVSGGTNEDARREGYDQFVTRVASAQRDGYTAYWLGRSFPAANVTFTGPTAGSSSASDVRGGGLDMTYAAEVVKNGSVELQLVEYSPTAWDLVKRELTLVPADARHRLLTVHGQSTELWTLDPGSRPTLRLVLVFGDTHVFIAASAGGSLEPGGPDLNPLVDEQTFLDVVQNLRPYPQ